MTHPPYTFFQMSFKEFHDSLSKFGPVTKIQIKYAVVTFGSKESAEKYVLNINRVKKKIIYYDLGSKI